MTGRKGEAAERPLAEPPDRTLPAAKRREGLVQERDIVGPSQDLSGLPDGAIAPLVHRLPSCGTLIVQAIVRGGLFAPAGG